jgi:hypothetical protein
MQEPLLRPGLPDGIFSNQKFQFRKNLEGLARENVVTLVVYLTATLSILRPFGIFCGHFDIFSPVLVCCTKENLAALPTTAALTTTTLAW